MLAASSLKILFGSESFGGGLMIRVLKMAINKVIAILV